MDGILREIKSFKENAKFFGGLESMEKITAKEFVRNMLYNPKSELYIDQSAIYPSLEKVLEIIHECGGLAFLAHLYVYSESVAENLDNIVEKYVAKFNTLAGLAYLKKSASLFIENVDPLQYPIDNLFAYCFENLAWLLASSYSIEDILKKCLLIHNGIIAGEYKVYHNNYDYPLDTFLSSDNLESIRNICYVVATSPFDSLISDKNKTFKKQ